MVKALNTLTSKTKYQVSITIGAGTHIREYCTIHLPVEEETSIGKDCFIMNHVNIGHDVKIGNNVVVSNGAQIGGHCKISDNVNLGLNCSIHQKTFIGAYSIIGMNTCVKNNVEPFTMMFKEKKSINVTGIRRSKLNKNMRSIIDYKKRKIINLKKMNSDIIKYIEEYNAANS